jgi:hypothetical protein
MIRIETLVRWDRVIFAVIGRIESNDLPELKRLIESHDPPVILDLKGVRLVDATESRFSRISKRITGESRTVHRIFVNGYAENARKAEE